MTELEALERPVLSVPHDDLRLADGRRLRRWTYRDPRRLRQPPPGMLDWEGWDGPQRMTVVCSLDDGPHGILLHVSLAYQDHDPSWAEIKLVRAAFFPDTIDVMMMLPRASDYIAGVAPVLGFRGRVVQRGGPGGADSHVFHLQQCPAPWGIL